MQLHPNPCFYTPWVTHWGERVMCPRHDDIHEIIVPLTLFSHCGQQKRVMQTRLTDQFTELWAAQQCNTSVDPLNICANKAWRCVAMKWWITAIPSDVSTTLSCSLAVKPLAWERFMRVRTCSPSPSSREATHKLNPTSCAMAHSGNNKTLRKWGFTDLWLISS